ncbi:MAG: hypothetical protein HQL58_04420 [Magnetococcales bacterium]|nr:hypothetical protein [Magnetococcales bacterium]
MFALIAVVAVLTIVLWTLVRLRDIREKSRAQKLPSDQGTVLLGMFYTISDACIRYNRDKGHYPLAISSAPDALIELGYLRNSDLASMTSALQLFSIIASEKVGFGVCLANTTSEMSVEIMERARMTGNNVAFVDFKNDQYVTLTPPIRNDFINLTLPLPYKAKR